MPQSQTAANTRHQEEEKKDKNIHAENKLCSIVSARNASKVSSNMHTQVCRLFYRNVMSAADRKGSKSKR